MNYIPDEIIKAYSEPHRRFHTMEHIYAMLEYCGLDRPTKNEHLFHAILWHDVVYVPGALDNEEKSAETWLAHSHPDCNSNYTDDEDFDREYVAELILSTKGPYKYYTDKNKRLINEADFSIFTKCPEELMQYEKDIFYEFQKYPLEEYIKGREEFLLNTLELYTKDSVPYKNIIFLLKYNKGKQYKIGIYPGSFNPFHIGHLDIIKQAEQVFDKVIIAQGYNRDKGKPIPLHDAIQETIVYDGLLTDLFEGNSYSLIRGLRDAEDLRTDLSLKQTLVDLGLTNSVVYFTCKPELRHISSSMIKSLYDFDESLYKRYLV